jgi:hypothetical protein
MRTLNPTTEEFVRHYRLLIERTKNDPARLLEAADEFPDLAACIDKLHEIDQAVEWHRHFGNSPFIVQTHPEFRRAVGDFRSRWATAYNALRNKRYEEAALRVSEEYMRCYRILVERTGDDLSAAHSLAEQSPDLDRTVRILREIDEVLYGDQKDFDSSLYDIAKIQELRCFSGVLPPEFEAIRADVNVRYHQCAPVWVPNFPNYLAEAKLDEAERNSRREQRRKQREKQIAALWLKELLDGLPDPPRGAIESEAAEGRRSFDPGRDSAADAIMSAEYFFEQKQENDWVSMQHLIEYRASEAFDWIHEAKGLNLRKIEHRIKEFPDFIVPQHVSDHYGVEAPHGLFAYLSQVRLAYIIGADLAAIALCRSVTELLIRYHYASGIPHASNSRKTGLKWLIEQIQDRDDFKFLRCFNLVAKVDEANDIIHQAATAIPIIEHRERARGLLTGWIRVLEEMIDKAPASASTVP